MRLKFLGSKMAVRLVLTLLALRMAHSASLPPITPDSSSDTSEEDAVLETSADGRLDVVGDGDDEPIALLIGKDVKRVMRRKGSNLKAFRRREQHKDSESHLLESHEWSRRGSELERILDPVSLEDPKDIELKKAIAQLLKEVADREEKRRNKQHFDSNEGNSKESYDNVSHEDLNISTDHHELKTSQDYRRHDGTIENHDEVDDHVDTVIDTIEDSDDTEFHSSSIDVDRDSKLNDEDFESMESDYDHFEDRVSHELKKSPKKQDSLKRDDHHDEKHTDVQHNIDNGLKHKDNHHSLNSLVSKETTEEETEANIDNITLEQSIDGVSEDKSDKLEQESSEKESQTINGNSYKYHGYETSDHHHDKQQNIDFEISHDVEKITETQKDDQSRQNHDNDEKPEQKKNEIHKDLQNENASENILSKENHDEDNNDDESDQIQVHEERLDSKNNRHYSFENNDIFNDNSDEKRLLKDQGAQKTIDQSSKDDNEFNSRLSYDDSSKAETDNNKIKNDLSSNLNPTNEALKDDHQKDSIEILRYHLPQRRYRSRGGKISKNYRRSSRKRAPMTQYTLSFFLRK